MLSPSIRQFRLAKIALVASVIVGSAFVAIPSASATVTSGVSTGTLTITGDSANDSISVSCIPPNVAVNGSDPDSGTATCTSITAIVVNAGAGGDSVDMNGVASGDFPAITSVTVNAGDGDDTVYGSGFADTINGEGNDDTLSGLGGNDTVDGGLGFDAADANVFAPQASTTITDSSITSTTGGTDTISNLEQVQASASSGGSIDASATSLTTMQFGTSGAETLTGGSARDVITANGGADTIVTNAGKDLVDPGLDAVPASIDGGADIDAIQSDLGPTSSLTNSAFNNGFGTDTLTGIDNAILTLPVNGTFSASTFTGVTTLSDNTGSEHITGGLGKDTIVGGAGNDVFKGNAGNDKLLGGKGNDSLNGGPGKDSCKGGPGTDVIKACE